jgi:tetratricopeptide (TPR) repeat protein
MPWPAHSPYESWLAHADELIPRSDVHRLTPTPVAALTDRSVREDIESDPVQWFEYERASLFRVVRQAHREEHWAGVCGLATRLHACAQQRVYWASWSEALELAVDAGQRLSREDQEAVPAHQPEGSAQHHARALFALGDALIVQERIDDAQVHLERARQTFEALADRPNEARAALDLGYVLLERGDLGEAEERLRQALATFRADRESELEGDRESELEAEALADLGLLCLRRHDLVAAIENLTASVAVFRQLDNHNWLAYALVTLGESQLAADDVDASVALATLREALPLLEQLTNRLWSAHSLEALGEIFARHGDPRTARRAWRHAIEILELFESPEAARVRRRLYRRVRMMDWLGDRIGRPSRRSKEVGDG